MIPPKSDDYKTESDGRKLVYIIKICHNLVFFTMGIYFDMLAQHTSLAGAYKQHHNLYHLFNIVWMETATHMVNICKGHTNHTTEILLVKLG